VKVCDISPGQQLAETIEREAQLQRSVLHSNITQVYEIIHHDEKVYIFMDFCKNGELFDRINR
jgi:serine/threonine protein kinase